jgi:hypothetical protein
MHSPDVFPSQRISISPVLRGPLVVVYCIALLFTFDLIYSNFMYDDDSLARISDPDYHHSMKPNFAGYKTRPWDRSPFYTNSLGFRDSAVRQVPLASTSRRVVLMGDSFTEGVRSFDHTFAGMLYEAGQRQSNKIEFLNAGVSSYSPVIYYRKTKALIDWGLQFDEMVVFSDISDVWDESRGYFCVDDNPRYFKYCDPAEMQILQKRDSTKSRLQRNFVITDKLTPMIKDELWRLRYKIRHLGGGRTAVSKAGANFYILYRYPVGGWTIPSIDVGEWYAPLGVEGGIARSLQNMKNLADLLTSRGIPLSIVIYPWPTQLANEDRESRQVKIWRDFCAQNCKRFINLFPAFFTEKDAHQDWYERLFNEGDVHFSAEGDKLMFRELSKHLL